jgi:hypothetical protein
MRKVYIPIVPTRYDSASKMKVPSLDLNPAEKWGELVVMVDNPGRVEDNLAEIRQKAQRITSQDFILAAGDLVALAAAIAHALVKNGVVTVLRWDKRKQDYSPVEVLE